MDDAFDSDLSPPPELPVSKKPPSSRSVPRRGAAQKAQAKIAAESDSDELDEELNEYIPRAGLAKKRKPQPGKNILRDGGSKRVSGRQRKSDVTLPTRASQALPNGRSGDVTLISENAETSRKSKNTQTGMRRTASSSSGMSRVTRMDDCPVFVIDTDDDPESEESDVPIHLEGYASPGKRFGSRNLPHTPSKRRKHQRDDDILEIDKTPRTNRTFSRVNSSLYGSSLTRVDSILKSPSRKTREDVWDLDRLRRHNAKVFVRLNESGDVGCTGELGHKLSWWPCSVTKSNPLQVFVYGNFFDGRGLDNRQINDPTPETIVSLLNPVTRTPRFSKTTYYSCIGIPNLPGQNHPALDTRWTGALDAARNDDDDDDEDEDHDLDFNPLPPSSQFETEIGSDDIEEDAQSSELNPAEVAQMMTNANELMKEAVLAKIKRQHKHYWCGQIIAVVPPDTASRRKDYHKPRFVVRFLDGKKHTLSRDLILVRWDHDYQLCEEGVWKIELPHNYVPLDKRPPSPVPREPSPEPIYPAPPPGSFQTLTMRQQFRYIRPVLGRITRDEHVPSKTRREMFYEGGMSREHLSRNVRCGPLEEYESEELQNEVSRWALRADEPQPSSSSVIDQPARPKGSEAYEGLTPSLRSQFALDVLYPEAIIQLLLWRDGHYLDGRDLTEEDDRVAYERGLDLLEEEPPSACQTKVRLNRMLGEKRRREKAEAQRKEDTSSDADPLRGGTRSRPRSWAVHV